MKTNYIIRKWLWLIVLWLSFVWISFASYNLKITEVFYDGSDEWIEIFNLWDSSFSGSLILSWAKTANINLNNILISSSWFILVWDEWQNILDKTYFYSWYSLSISDTKEISIDLLEHWQLLDNFSVSSNLVLQYNNYNTSFEKILSWFSLLLTAVNLDRVYNFSSPWQANPWKIYSYSWTIPDNWDVDGSNILSWDILTWDSFTGNGFTWSLSWDWIVHTWNVIYDTVYSYLNCKISKSHWSYSWDKYFTDFSVNSIDSLFCDYPYAQSWFLNSIIVWTWCNVSLDLGSWENLIDFHIYSWWQLLCSNSYVLNNTFFTREIILTWGICNGENISSLIITEVNPIDSQLPEYLELQSLWNYSWDIEIIWLWRWSISKKFSLNLASGQYLIITDTMSGFLYTWDIMLISGISISDN